MLKLFTADVGATTPAGRVHVISANPR